MLFSRQFEVQSKIWKFKNSRGRPPGTSFIWLLLPWKPIRHNVVSLNWKYKSSLLDVPNFMSIGWIVCVESRRGGGPIDPPPFKASCNYFFFEAFWANKRIQHHPTLLEAKIEPIKLVQHRLKWSASWVNQCWSWTNINNIEMFKRRAARFAFNKNDENIMSPSCVKA